MPLPKSVLCSSCRKTYPEGWKRCPYCGFDEMRARQDGPIRKFMQRKLQEFEQRTGKKDARRDGGGPDRPPRPDARPQKQQQREQGRDGKSQRGQRGGPQQPRPPETRPPQQQAAAVQVEGERTGRRRRRRRGAGRGEGSAQPPNVASAAPNQRPAQQPPREPRPPRPPQAREGARADAPAPRPEGDGGPRKRRRFRRRRPGGGDSGGGPQSGGPPPT